MAGNLEYVRGLLADLADGDSDTGDGSLLPSTYANTELVSSTEGENTTGGRETHRGAQNPPAARHGRSRATGAITGQPKHPWTQSLNGPWWRGWGR